MGSLRLLLAVSVVAFHAGSIFGFRGMEAEAVPAFFVISGFYMALILDTTYRGAVRTFYENRLLRLFPLYWAVLALIVLLAALPDVGMTIVDNTLFSARMQLSRMSESWAAAVPNIFIAGSDWLRVLTVNPVDGTWGWWPRRVPEGPTLKGAYQYLGVPQIWSVAVELTFYAVAPALVRLRTRTLVVLCVVAAIVGPWLSWHLSFRHMLPSSNFWFFVLGIIEYRALLRMQTVPRAVHVMLACVPFVVAICWRWMPINPLSRDAPEVGLMIVLFSIGLPSLYVLSMHWTVDRWVGELSYPLYITHLLFQFGTSHLGTYSGAMCLAVSLAMSALLLLLVQAPVERIRRARAKSRPPSSAARVDGFPAATAPSSASGTNPRKID